MDIYGLKFIRLKFIRLKFIRLKFIRLKFIYKIINHDLNII